MADRIMLPSSGGGLVRYFEDYRSRFQIRPSIVIVAIVLIIFIEVYLHSL